MSVGILGGGIAGLASAHYLSKKGIKVTILEKSDELGGLLKSIKLDHNYLEGYYHHIFSSHTDVMALLEDLGMSSDLSWYETKMGFYIKGKLYPFNGAIDLLRFKPLGLLNRIRFGLGALYLKKTYNENWHQLSALDLVEKVFGRAGVKAIWEPLLQAKFGSYYKKIPAAWLVERILSRSKHQGVANRTEKLGYLDGGFYRLVNALEKRVRSRGVQVHKRFNITKMECVNHSFRVLGDRGELFTFSHLINTLPLPALRAIDSNLPDAYRSLSKEVIYQTALVGVLILKRRLTDYLWINVADQKSPFVVLVEHTNMVSPQTYGGRHVVYLGSYIEQGHEYESLSDVSLKGLYIDSLKRMFPQFDKKDILDFYLFKGKNAQPVFTTNYNELKRKLEKPVDNMISIDTSQVYPESRSMNSAIAMAKRAVEQISRDYN